MQTYETLFIINPDLEENEITKTIDLVQDIITTGGGTILKVDKWGRRQLAYQIQKKREGYYVLIYFQAPPTLVVEMNRRYKLTDTIMRYLIVQLRKSQVEELLRSTKSAESISPTEPSEPPVDEEHELENTGVPQAEKELTTSKEG